jgi:hypothetical protein
MSFYDFASETAGRQEEHAVPAGEYKMKIVDARMWHGESGDAIMARLEHLDDPYASNVSAFIGLPSSGRDEREKNRLKNLLALFMQCFELDPSVEAKGEDEVFEDWIGQEGYVTLKKPVDKGDGYGPQNKLKGFVVSR